MAMQRIPLKGEQSDGKLLCSDLMPSAAEKSTPHGSAPEEELDSEQGGSTTEWRGPVFHIRYDAYGSFPRVRFADSDVRRFDNTIEVDVTEVVNPEELPATAAGHGKLDWRGTLVIKSPHLYQELRRIVRHSPGDFPILYADDYNTHWEEELPYSNGVLLFHFGELEARISEEHSNERKRLAEEFHDNAELGRAHLKLLLKHLQPIHQETEAAVQRLTTTDGPLCIPFDLVWYFFPPGTKVYVRGKNPWTPWHVAIVHRISLAYSTPPSWMIDYWVLSSNGSKVGRYMPDPVEILGYDGLKAIDSFEICPIQIWDRQNNRERQQIAIKRGRLMFDVFQAGHMVGNYAARAASGEQGYDGHVVVDHRRGQEMTGLRMKPMNLYATKYDIYSSWDDFVVQRPWTWTPQNFLLTEEYKTMVANLPDPERDYADLGRREDRRHRSPYLQYPRDEYGRDIYNVENVHEPRMRYRRDNEERYDYERRRGHEPRTDFRRVLPLTADFLQKIEAPSSTELADDVEFTTEMSDEQLMLLYPLTFGFSLKAKTWSKCPELLPCNVEIDATHLSRVEKSDKSFDNLVLDEESLMILKTIIKRLQKHDSSWSADFIHGKGQGSMVLLHGPPGVGKTFTVEAIAEKLDCPLLALTVADIGTEESKIEKELLRWFALAEIWNAILLIDEADIFLEQRHTRDLKRNGLVSAFLRRAEYFRGLLFITTNRVGHVDDAFISRIQFSIHYTMLTPERQADLWNRFFNKLRDENRDDDSDSQPSGTQQAVTRRPRVKISREDAEDVKAAFRKGKYADLNGRDIRNVLQTAITLAEYNSFTPGTGGEGSGGTVTVTYDHIEKVLKMQQKFRTYLKSNRHKDEQGRAQARWDRADDRGDDSGRG